MRVIIYQELILLGSFGAEIVFADVSDIKIIKDNKIDYQEDEEEKEHKNEIEELERLDMSLVDELEVNEMDYKDITHEDEFNKNMMKCEKINAFKLIYQYIPDINSYEDVNSFCTDYLGLDLYPHKKTMIKILDKLKNINLFNLK